jgi:hypothetical protein
MSVPSTDRMSRCAAQPHGGWATPTPATLPKLEMNEQDHAREQEQQQRNNQVREQDQQERDNQVREQDQQQRNEATTEYTSKTSNIHHRTTTLTR